MNEQLALLPEYLTAHLQLTLLALLCSTAVSLPAGVAVTRAAWLERPVLGAAAVIQTVPSLALLAVMVPLLAGLGVQSIGFLPAFIGLTLYGVLPILRNTVTGIAGVDPARGGRRRLPAATQAGACATSRRMTPCAPCAPSARSPPSADRRAAAVQDGAGPLLKLAPSGRVTTSPSTDAS